MEETISQNKAVVDSMQTISIFDLGIQASDMIKKWKVLMKQDIQITIKEFPNIDFTQMIEDKQLMELILEFAVVTEVNKRKVAKQKQAEGIAKARKKGVKLGRREKKIPENFVSVYERVIAKKMTMKRATEILDVDYKTYRKWIKQYKENK